MNNKFNFYEIVKVLSKKSNLQEINGCEGVVKGKSQCEDTGNWGYAVSIYKDNGIVWDIMEEDLISTGKLDDHSKYSPTEHVKIQVDLKTGKGEIVDDD
jgi:hypothetical protein